MLDLVIRNGLIVDGSGLPRRRGDVSIQGGRIVAVGGRGGDAHRELDATGRVVSPGFIDPHTHYDAQLCFDPYAFPAIELSPDSVSRMSRHRRWSATRQWSRPASVAGSPAMRVCHIRRACAGSWGVARCMRRRLSHSTASPLVQVW